MTSDSEPIPTKFGYLLIWAEAVVPIIASYCPNYVFAYYNGPEDSECCIGWQKSEMKKPIDESDNSPIFLDLCGAASRRLIIEVKIWGHIVTYPVTLDDDIPRCKITTTTTTASPYTGPPTTTLPEICRKKYDLKFSYDLIKQNSKPLHHLGKYSLDWAAVANPKGAGVCFDKVVAYYNGPYRTQCCDDWEMAKPKFPRRNNDDSPIILNLCGNATPLVSVSFEYNGHG